MDQGRWIPGVTALQGDSPAMTAPPGDAVDIRWGPDGRRLLVVTTHSSPPETRVLPYRVESSSDWSPSLGHTAWIVQPGGDPVPVAGGLGHISMVDWSPDGDRVAVVSDHGVDRDTSIAAGVWLWSPTSGESQPLVAPTHPILAIAWSPEGTSLAYLASAEDNVNSAVNGLWVVGTETGERHRLGTGLDRSLGKAVRGDDERGIGPPILVWNDDSESVLAIYSDGGRSRLGRFRLDGSHETLDMGQDCVLEFDRGQAGVAFSWSDPVTPGEVSWTGPGGGTTQLSGVGEELLSEVTIATTSRVSVVASDGVEVEGWLTVPAEPQGAPLVLQVHGGPHYAVGERFSFDAQRFAALGIAFLRANPRGSQGYGQAFAAGNLGDWGGRDLADLLELLDQTLEQTGLDDSRVAIIGESYGGYMALWAVGATDRFAAAVVENGMADLLSSASGAIGPTFWHSELGGAPWDQPAIYLDRSPITLLDRVEAPVLVIHCEEDTTCPVAQGEAIFSGLRELGADVQFWRVPGEGHFVNVFGALSRRLERTKAMDEFIVAKLGVDSTDTPTKRQEITS
jgi:dipeptidyl aminopeptidase/acylaminoacyl peptidase